eukprot:1476908-Prymnesium_polylepis.2
MLLCRRRRRPRAAPLRRRCRCLTLCRLRRLLTLRLALVEVTARRLGDGREPRRPMRRRLGQLLREALPDLLERAVRALRSPHERVMA